jgi:hypothetical protein
MIIITDNNGNTTRKRYPFEGTLYPTCQCPICKCTCFFACTMGDFSKLLLATRNIPHLEDQESSLNTKQVIKHYQSPIDSTTSYISLFCKNVIREAVKSGLSDMQSDYKQLSQQNHQHHQQQHQ